MRNTNKTDSEFKRPPLLRATENVGGASLMASATLSPTVSEVLGSKTNKNLKIALVVNKYIQLGNYDTAQKLLSTAQGFPYKSLTDYLIFQCIKARQGEWPIDWHKEFAESKEMKDSQELPDLLRKPSPTPPLPRDASKSVAEVVTSSGAVAQSEKPLTQLDLLKGVLGSLSINNSEGFLAQVILQDKEKFIEQMKEVALMAQSLGADGAQLIDKIAEAFKAKAFIPTLDQLQIRINLKGGVDFLSDLSVKTGKELSEAKAAIDLLISSNRINSPSSRNPKDTVMSYVLKTESIDLLEYVLGKPEINLKQFPNAISTAIKSKDVAYFRPKALEILLNRKELDTDDKFTNVIDQLQKDGEYELTKWWFEQAKQKLQELGITEVQSAGAADIYVSANLFAYNLGKCADSIAPFIEDEKEQKAPRSDASAEKKQEEKSDPKTLIKPVVKENIMSYLQGIVLSLSDSSNDHYLSEQVTKNELAFLKSIKDIFLAADIAGTKAQKYIDKIIEIMSDKQKIISKESFWKIKIILKGGIDSLCDTPVDVSDSAENEELTYAVDILVGLGLINQRSKGDPRKTAADYIAAMENIALFKHFLAKPVVDLSQSPLIVATILSAGNEVFRYEALDLVLDRNDIDLNTIPEEAVLSPLHLAVQNGDKIAVLKLIKAGASVNTPNKDGLMPLHLAANFDRAELVSILINAGAALDAVGGKAKETALQMAFNNSHFESCVRLIEAGASLTTPNKKGDTFLDMIDRPIDTQVLGETRKESASYYTLSRLLMVKKQIDGNYLTMIEKWLGSATAHLEELEGEYNKITREYVLPIIDNLESATMSQELVGAGFNTNALIQELQTIKITAFPPNAYKELDRLEKLKRDIKSDRSELWQKLAIIGRYWLDLQQSGEEAKSVKTVSVDPDLLPILIREITKINAHLQAKPSPHYYVDITAIIAAIQKKIGGEEFVKLHYDFFSKLISHCTQNKHLFICGEDIEKRIMELADQYLQAVKGLKNLELLDNTERGLLILGGVFKTIDDLAHEVEHISFESRLSHAIETRNFNEIEKFAVEDLSTNAGFGLKKEKKEDKDQAQPKKVIAEDLAFLLMERLADNNDKAISAENLSVTSRNLLQRQDSRRLNETLFRRSMLFSEALKTLIKVQKINLNITDSEGLTLLHRAAECGAEDIVKLLLSGNRQVDLEVIAGVTAFAGRPGEKVGSYGGRSDKTAIHYAIENGHNSIVTMMVNGGVNLENKGGSNVNMTPIRSTVFAGASSAGGKRQENFVAATILLCCDRQKINKDFCDVLDKWTVRYSNQQYSSHDVTSLINKIGSASPEMIDLDEDGMIRLQRLKSALAVMLSHKEEARQRAASVSPLKSPVSTLFKAISSIPKISAIISKSSSTTTMAPIQTMSESPEEYIAKEYKWLSEAMSVLDDTDISKSNFGELIARISDDLSDSIFGNKKTKKPGESILLITAINQAYHTGNLKELPKINIKIESLTKKISGLRDLFQLKLDQWRQSPHSGPKETKESKFALKSDRRAIIEASLLSIIESPINLAITALEGHKAILERHQKRLAATMETVGGELKRSSPGLNNASLFGSPSFGSRPQLGRVSPLPPPSPRLDAKVERVAISPTSVSKQNNNLSELILALGATPKKDKGFCQLIEAIRDDINITFFGSVATDQVGELSSLESAIKRARSFVDLNQIKTMIESHLTLLNQFKDIFSMKLSEREELSNLPDSKAINQPSAVDKLLSTIIENPIKMVIKELEERKLALTKRQATVNNRMSVLQIKPAASSVSPTQDPAITNAGSINLLS